MYVATSKSVTMACRIFCLTMLFMLSMHGVLSQLRGSSVDLKAKPNDENKNGEKENEIKRERLHGRGTRKIVERLPRTFADPLSGKEDTRKHRVQLVRLQIHCKPTCSLVYECLPLFGSCRSCNALLQLRHLREKIISAEDGEMKQRLRSQLAFMYQLPTNEEDEHDVIWMHI